MLGGCEPSIVLGVVMLSPEDLVLLVIRMGLESLGVQPLGFLGFVVHWILVLGPGRLICPLPSHELHGGRLVTSYTPLPLQATHGSLVR